MSLPLVNAMRAQGAAAIGACACACVLELRAPGTETALEVEFAPLPEVARNFRAEFIRRFGFAPPADDPLVATLRAEAVVAGERQIAAGRARGDTGGTRGSRRPGSTAGARCRSSIAARLRRARRVAGPALIVEPNSTTVVESGWTAERLEDGSLRLSRQRAQRLWRRPMPDGPIPRSSNSSITASCRSPSRWVPCSSRPRSR